MLKHKLMKDLMTDKSVPAAIKQSYADQKENFSLRHLDYYTVFSSFPDKRPCLYFWDRENSILLTSFVAYYRFEKKKPLMEFNIGIHFKNHYDSWTGCIYTIEKFDMSSIQNKISNLNSSKTLSTLLRVSKMLPDCGKAEKLLASLDKG